MSRKRIQPLAACIVPATLTVALGAGIAQSSVVLPFLLATVAVGVALIVHARHQGSRALPPADREIKLLAFILAVLGLAGAVNGWISAGSDRTLMSWLPFLPFLLFWPLFVAIRGSRITATISWLVLMVCTALLGAAAGLEIVSNSVDSAPTTAVGPDPDLALILALFLVLCAAFFQASRRHGPMLASLAAAGLALLACLITDSGPQLIVIAGLIPLLAGFSQTADRLRIGGFGLLVLVPAALLHPESSAGAMVTGPNELQRFWEHNGLLPSAAWIGAIAVPLRLFLPLMRHASVHVAYLAAAGTLMPAAFGLLALTGTSLAESSHLTVYLLALTLTAHLLWQTVEQSLVGERNQRITATVITFNEADNIGDCLESVLPVADEIIVVDSGSTDDTVRIARQYTDKVMVTDWPGFGLQKQRALDQATGDWVLSIDADERVTPYLAREINHHLDSAPDADAYKLPWAVTIYGKRLDFGRSARAPLRLFRRQGARFTPAQVHETIDLPANARVRTLRGRLTHYTHRDYGHAIGKSAQYAWLGAQQRAQKGRRTRTLAYPTFRAITTFLQVYIIRLGFLDGSVGYLMAMIYAQTSFNTFAGLWTIQHQPQAGHDN